MRSAPSKVRIIWVTWFVSRVPSKPSIVFSSHKPFYGQPNYFSWWLGIFWHLFPAILSLIASPETKNLGNGRHFRFLRHVSIANMSVKQNASKNGRITMLSYALSGDGIQWMTLYKRTIAIIIDHNLLRRSAKCSANSLDSIIAKYGLDP